MCTFIQARHVMSIIFLCVQQHPPHTRQRLDGRTMKSKMLSPVLRSGCLTSKNVSQKVTQLPQLGGNHAALSVKMYSTSHSQLASTSAPPDAAAAPDVGSVVPKPSQAFVKARFKPGEWDLEFKDPLYRPNFFGNAKILAAEDFHARPKVGTSDSFANFTEAMSTPCWTIWRITQ